MNSGSYLVYLAGPIMGCTDEEAHTWREITKEQIGVVNCLDPMRRDYRGREDEYADEIVRLDEADIRASRLVLANCWTPSSGTSMEIMYAWEWSVPVIAMLPPGAKVSPWIRYHSQLIVPSLHDAISEIKGRMP